MGQQLNSDVTISEAGYFNNLSSFKGIWNEIMYETAHFVVLPTLGMLIPDWVLIVPKRSILNFGLLNNEEEADLLLLEEKLHGFYSSKGKKITLFEHGPASANSTVGCGVDYAHRHCVPLDFSLINASIEEKNILWESAKELFKELRLTVNSGFSYLHVRELGVDYLCKSEIAFESQILRKVIANESGQEAFWDWKTEFFQERINDTIRTFDIWKASQFFSYE